MKRQAAPPITSFSKMSRQEVDSAGTSRSKRASESAGTVHNPGPCSSGSSQSALVPSRESGSDIGRLLQLGLDLKKLSRDDKYRVLTTEPNPDASYYPRTRPGASGSYRQFQPSWLKQYPWLHYSRQVDGVFCRACAFFAPETVGGHVPGQFVTKPFKSWIKMSEKVNAHGKVDYHLGSLTKMSEFRAWYEDPSQAIHTKLSSEAQKRMENNEKVIESLFKVVLLCGKQGLAFRGHRDDHVSWTELEDSSANQGNFIEVVRFRAETDHVLSSHLQNSPANARYTSKTIQNELIDVIGKCICNDIIDEVKRSKYYTLIADEVTDTSNKEQLSISLRYVLVDVVKEVFVGFISVERITGESLADAILTWLVAAGLSPSDMRGQCYDGASNMSGARSGCRSIVQRQAPMATYFHCAAHRLNLAVMSACKIQAFKNVESYIGDISRFFAFSAKRQRLFDRAMDMIHPPTKAKKLKDACRTRWIQRIDSYVVFLELLPALQTTLQAMVIPRQYEDLGTDWTWDGETITKANGFLFQLQSSQFLIGFKILLEGNEREGFKRVQENIFRGSKVGAISPWAGLRA